MRSFRTILWVLVAIAAIGATVLFFLRPAIVAGPGQGDFAHERLQGACLVVEHLLLGEAPTPAFDQILGDPGKGHDQDRGGEGDEYAGEEQKACF